MILKSVIVCGVLVGVGALGLVGAEHLGGAPGSALVSQRNPEEASARASARAMLNAPTLYPFVGTIDFEVTSASGDGAGQDRTWRRARLYLAANGAVRLDYWIVDGDERPWACCVNRETAWMVVGSEGLVHVSRLPVAESASGWLLQLGYQAKQALAWARKFSCGEVNAFRDWEVTEAEITGGVLRVRAEYSGEGGPCAELAVVGERATDRGAYLPTRVSGSGFAIERGDYVFTAGGAGVPCRVVEYAADGVTAVREFVVTGFRPYSRDDARFVQFFEIPRRGGPGCERFPRLAATVSYDAQGIETLMNWN
ncbi:MAG TPA: hypothetical protein PKK06_14015 [Phycisphaerae bacterium]|nr:hypothetical protein [Phycisphaerae bacterium]HNU46405.1 hypothetical protein [Phycisphaerae bacterium]